MELLDFRAPGVTRVTVLARIPQEPVDDVRLSGS